ncbi:hypothetical protein [Oricola cellulosilytica]|uniref:hypothetical protein n=1 Tax=Oricola cellulosilytica TaxID=1429082 RepID=UPI001304D8DF|nr:hypothetical protein [Oricola cellulosilytica]
MPETLGNLQGLSDGWIAGSIGNIFGWTDAADRVANGGSYRNANAAEKLSGFEEAGPRA